MKILIVCWLQVVFIAAWATQPNALSSSAGERVRRAPEGQTKYNTSLGSLEDGAIRESGAVFEFKDGNIVVSEALYRIDARHAFAVRPAVSISSKTTDKGCGDVTFVRDESSAVWLATNGCLGETYGAPHVFEGQVVQVVGGATSPISIGVGSFSNTLLEIRAGKPVPKASKSQKAGAGQTGK